MPKITLPNKLNEVIEAGGVVPNQEKENKVLRVTLYLPSGLKEQIEKARISSYRRHTINSWITEAIILKLKKG